MPFVFRRDGVITEAFEQPQYEAHDWDVPQEEWVPTATEWKEEDDAEVVAFRQSMVAPDKTTDVDRDEAKADAMSLMQQGRVAEAFVKLLELIN